MDDSDDQLEIVNRSETFIVSKKLLCSSIPYFEKMFCCDLLESKENKVTLDLDESGFNNVLNYVHTNMFVLSLENVIQTYDCCEYLMIDDLQKECSDYFYRNFNLEFLPSVLLSVDERSKLITPSIINCFTRRHFLKISNTKVFYNLTDDALEYILKLDLVIDSEYQVFDAIKRWILFDKDGGRNKYLTDFLKLIRWCNIEQNDLTKIKGDSLVKNHQDLDEIIISTSSDCKKNGAKNRVIDNSPLTVHKIDESTIEICQFNGSSLCYPCGNFSLNESLPTNLITDEHVVDILYDSGRKGIRVDWQLKMFKYLDMIGTDDSYYGQIHRYIMFSYIKSSTTRDLNWLLTDPIVAPNDPTRKFQDVLLDSGGIFTAIGPTSETNRFHLTSPIIHGTWFCVKPSQPAEIHVCAIKDKIYIITKDLGLFMVDLTKQKMQQMILSYDDEGFVFDDIHSFSHRDNLFLEHKSKQKIYTFNQSKLSWSLICQLRTSRQLIAISTTYSSSNDIKMIYSKK